MGSATITRFFSLHFLIPFIISALSILHILLLHQVEVGSSNPLLGNIKEPIKFHPYFQLKDMYGVIFVTISFFFFLFYYPNYFSHSDNYILANAVFFISDWNTATIPPNRHVKPPIEAIK